MRPHADAAFDWIPAFAGMTDGRGGGAAAAISLLTTAQSGAKRRLNHVLASKQQSLPASFMARGPGYSVPGIAAGGSRCGHGLRRPNRGHGDAGRRRPPSMPGARAATRRPSRKRPRISTNPAPCVRRCTPSRPSFRRRRRLSPSVQTAGRSFLPRPANRCPAGLSIRPNSPARRPPSPELSVVLT